MLPSSSSSIVSPDMSSYLCFVPFCNKNPKRLDGIKITDKLVVLLKEMRGKSVWSHICDLKSQTQKIQRVEIEKMIITEEFCYMTVIRHQTSWRVWYLGTGAREEKREKKRNRYVTFIVSFRGVFIWFFFLFKTRFW